jgi:uncharacterized protein YndB with AHSA1/START domain
MKVLKITGIVILSIAVILVITLAIMSPKSHLERSVVINAQPASVYEELVSFKNVNSWSPWFKMDPKMKHSFEGPPSGVGAKMSWDSENPEVGKGSQWIVETEENKRVKSGMNFDGMDGNFVAEFILEPTPEGTKVTWTYDGDVSNTSTANAAMGKFFGAFMDSMLGPSLEQGLVALKQKVENKPQPTQEIVVTQPTQP